MSSTRSTINTDEIYFPNGQWLRRELEEMLIIDDTLLPLIAVLMLLDELARLRKFRNFGDLFPDSPSLFNPVLCEFESLESVKWKAKAREKKS